MLRETIFSTTMPWACRPLRLIGEACKARRLSFWRRVIRSLVGAEHQRLRHGGAERFCRLEIEEQIESGGLLDRRVGGLCPFQYLVDVGAARRK
jgi:hypothetical protein